MLCIPALEGHMGHGRDEPNASGEVMMVLMETRERTKLNSRSEINHSLRMILHPGMAGGFLHLRTGRSWRMKIKFLPGNPLSQVPLEYPFFLEHPGEASTDSTVRVAHGYYPTRRGCTGLCKAKLSTTWECSHPFSWPPVSFAAAI